MCDLKIGDYVEYVGNTRGLPASWRKKGSKGHICAIDDRIQIREFSDSFWFPYNVRKISSQLEFSFMENNA